MRIGYACLAVGVPETGMKSCVMKNATAEKLTELIGQNLLSLENIIEYNHKNDIRLFRISSDLIPFGSSPVNQLDWWNRFEEDFKRIGEKIQKYKIRVSMHPGQYTVLNSPKEDVADRAVEDLVYHANLLDLLGADRTCKIVLHAGGVYGDKKLAADRFIEKYKQLGEQIKNRLVIENDDRSFSVENVMSISNKTGIPVVFDNLHYALNPGGSLETDVYWIRESSSTWKEEDGNPKIHYSQANGNKKSGSHSDTIRITPFLEFCKSFDEIKPDIMLEVKDKNLSAIKCINCVMPGKTARDLELEWSRYKYKVLENSQIKYNEIRQLLKDKKCSPIRFYEALEEGILTEGDTGSTVNAAQHVWGYFKDRAEEKEKNKFFKDLSSYQNKEKSIEGIKKYLWKLAQKYQEEYLLNSYYFFL